MSVMNHIQLLSDLDVLDIPAELEQIERVGMLATYSAIDKFGPDKPRNILIEVDMSSGTLYPAMHDLSDLGLVAVRKHPADRSHYICEAVGPTVIDQSIPNPACSELVESVDEVSERLEEQI